MQGSKVSSYVKEFEKSKMTIKNENKNNNNNNNKLLNGGSGQFVNQNQKSTNQPFSYIKTSRPIPSPFIKPGTPGSMVGRPPPTPERPQILPKPSLCKTPRPPIPPKPRCDSGLATPSKASSSNSSPTSSEIHLESTSGSLRYSPSKLPSFLHKVESSLSERRKISKDNSLKIRRRNTWPKFPQISALNSPRVNEMRRKPTGIERKSRPCLTRGLRPSTFDGSSKPLARTLSLHLGPDRDSLFSEHSSQYSGSDSDDEENGQISSESKLYLTAQEFFTTETRYVETLEALCVGFPKFIEKESHALHRPLVHPDIPSIISKSLESMLGLHKKLLASLENCVKNWNPESPGLASILIQFGPFLKMSSTFLQHKSSFAMQIVEACKKYPDFSAAVQAFERKVFNGLLLNHQLDCVHQRICRYPLLLSAYIKHSDPESDELALCREAKIILDKVAKDIEDSLVSGDDTRTLLELQRRIQSRFEIMQPGRKLLKEGEIEKHSRKELQNRTLLLFNDVLLYCAPVVPSNGNLWVRNEFDLATTRISVPQHIDQIDTFHIIGKKRSIILKTKTADERASWTAAIEKALKDIKQKRHFTPGEESPTEVSPTLPLGKVAPVWIPDDRVTMCQNCKVSFTKIRRRHHCRCCGKVICGNCQGHAPLEYENYVEKSVCPMCYQSLIVQVRDGDDYVAYSGIVCPSPSASMMQKNKPTRELLMGRFKPPKNPISDTNLNEMVLVDGFLSVLEKRNWIRYWVVLRPEGVLEFYGASGDPACKKKHVLLSFDVQERSIVNGGEQVVFNLVHTNQIATEDSSEVRLSLKAENTLTADRWIDGFRHIKSDMGYINN